MKREMPNAEHRMPIIEWTDIDAKYHALMPYSKLPAARIDQSLNVIHNFEQVKDASELTGLLKTSAGEG